jgi:hypothetical protein
MDLEALGPEDEDAELRDYVSVFIGEAEAPGLVWVEGELAVVAASTEPNAKKGTGRATNGTCGAGPRREINSGFQA